MSDFQILDGVLTKYRGSEGSVKVPDGVTSIGAWAFINCINLTSINLPEGLKTIDYSAFRGCSSLLELTIPDKVYELKTGILDGCSSIKRIHIPDSITEIDSKLFDACNRLSSGYISDAVSISDLSTRTKQACARIFCGSYEAHSQTRREEYDAYIRRIWRKLLTPAVENGDTAIVHYILTFSNLSIKELKLLLQLASNMEQTQTVSMLMEYQQHRYNEKKLERHHEVEDMKQLGLRELTVDDYKRDWSYKKLSDGTLCITRYKGSGVDVIIPHQIGSARVSTIEKEAFSEESNASNAFINPHIASIKSVLIPEGVIRINAGFGDCTSLNSVTIPKSIRSVDDFIFAGCVNLEEVTFLSGIPKVSKGMFKDCTGLKSITIPHGLYAIGNEAFSSCTFLEEVKLPDSVMTIGADAFLDCEKLTSIKIHDNVRELGSGAFRGCKGLSDKEGWVILGDILYDYYGCNPSPVVPSGIATISTGAFENQRDLRNITLPNSLRRIENRAFKGCKKLEKVVLPDNVEEIGTEVFQACRSLRSITLSKDLRRIGFGAFSGCVKLEEIVLPDNVGIIGSNAFSGCKSLRSITLPENPFMGSRVFDDCINLERVIVPYDMPETFGISGKRIGNYAIIKQDTSSDPQNEET